jgi:hypothetical protein
MNKLVEHIINKDYRSAELSLEESFQNIMERKLLEVKKRVAASMCSEDEDKEKDDEADEEEADEEDKEDVKEEQSPHDTRMGRLKNEVLEEDDEDLSEARINIVKARIRGGKIQRRKRVSNVPGMTLRGGKLTRMSPTERRKRKLGARKAARKSRGKKSQMLRKRKLSLMKRSRLGV